VTKPRALVSWSGGKDSCLALQRSRRQFELAGLITMFTPDGERSRSHGLHPETLELQASALGLPLLTGCASWEDYEERFRRLLVEARRLDVTHVVFGDIFLDPHKEWVERVCGAEGLSAVEPLWGESTEKLAAEFLSTGGRATIVTVCKDMLDSSWLGRELSPEVIRELVAKGVDACGERGEYHTVVTASPAFAFDLRLQGQTQVELENHWLLDVQAERRP